MFCKLNKQVSSGAELGGGLRSLLALWVFKISHLLHRQEILEGSDAGAALISSILTSSTLSASACSGLAGAFDADVFALGHFLAMDVENH